MMGGTIWATYLSYQNAPGGMEDKIFTATITFGVLGLAVILILRVLAAAVSVIIVAIVLGGLDIYANNGRFFSAVLQVAGPALIWLENSMRYLILGPIS